VLGAALAPFAQSQLSSSPNYQLTDFVLDGGGGGAASAGYGGWFSIGAASGGTLASSNYQAGVGILETSDPAPNANEPILFGLSPDLGNYAGGTSVTVSGWNFDKFGVGPSVTMAVGGNRATGTSVLTNTQMIATVPAGDPGPTAVVVTSSLGSGSDPDAWLYTPAVISTEFTQVGGQMDLRNYGTLGNTFFCLVSASAGFANSQFGPFLLGPTPFLVFLANVPYPAPAGIHTLHAKVPNNPILSGVTLYFQSLEATQVGPVQGRFTNASSITFQ